MFQVEKNASKKADKVYTEALKKGLGHRRAMRAADRVEKSETKAGNAWIKENVGLN